MFSSKCPIVVLFLPCVVYWLVISNPCFWKLALDKVVCGLNLFWITHFDEIGFKLDIRTFLLNSCIWSGEDYYVINTIVISLVPMMNFMKVTNPQKETPPLNFDFVSFIIHFPTTILIITINLSMVWCMSFLYFLIKRHYAVCYWSVML